MHHRRHRRRHWSALGWPEVFLAGLALLVIAPAVLWVRFEGRQNWRQTTGFARGAAIESTHYNATEYATKVTVDFEYAVGGMPYHDRWVGFWPAAGGPNALPANELDRLQRDGHPLTVFYDPESPWANYLHPDADLTRTLYAAWLAGGLGLFLLYCVRIYPRFRG